MNKLRVVVNGKQFGVQVVKRSGSTMTLEVNGTSYEVDVANDPTAALAVSQGAPPTSMPAPARSSPRSGDGRITAPMPGIVVSVEAQPGESVKAGQTLIVIEAMKMENPISAPRDGVVKEVLVKPKSEVAQGQELIVLV